jgi:hypothetical protein
MSAADWVDLAATVALGVVGLWLVHSISRRVKAEVALKVAEKRFDAYARLWAQTEPANAMRALVTEGPIPDDELRRLYDAMTTWYFANGDGMLLSPPSRQIYLKAKKNLVCPPDHFIPASAREAVVRDPAERSHRAIRQLSLLRAQMRADLQIFAGPYAGPPVEPDWEFLREAEVDLSLPPWSRAQNSGG